MTHEDIKKALQKAGLSFSALAAASGRTYQSLTAASKRDCKSKPAAKVIAAALGKPVSEVFDDVPEYQNPSKSEKKQKSIDKAKQLLKAQGIDVVEDVA